MAKTDNLGDFLLGIANAIRAKKGTTEPINAQDFESEISSLNVGGGGEIISCFTGIDEPDSTLGNNNDIFLLLTSYQVNTTLFHCTISNRNTKVEENGSYETTIVVDTDYALAQYSVVMGGQDITADVLNPDTLTINIPIVTGNITITLRCSSTLNITDGVGLINEFNKVSLNNTVPSGTYTLYYEDEFDTKLNDWKEIGQINQ